MDLRLTRCVGVALAVVAGCRTAHMPVPAELVGADRLSVEGRQGWKIGQRLRFGPYEAVEIRRSWVGGRDLEILGYEGNKRGQRFTFVLRESGIEGIGASCEVSLSARTIHAEVVDLELQNRSRLFCSLYPSREAARDWTLSLEEKGDRPLSGDLQVDGRTYDVRGTRKLAGGLPAESTSGYTIGREGVELAAVEVVGDGAVVLSSTVGGREQSLLAGAAAALLILEDLRGHLPATD